MQVKERVQVNPTLKLLTTITGLLISSVGVNGFIRRGHLLSGGVTGFATAINYMTGLNVGLMTFLLNIPIFILGFIFLKKEFCILSLINMAIYSFILGITQNIGVYIPIHDIFLQSIFGGFLNGLGIGMVFRTKSSTGGTDIIAAILKIKKNIEIKNTSFAMNVIVVLVGSIFFGLRLALYTLIGFYVGSLAMGFIKDAMNYQKSLIIISEKPELIADDILHSMNRGVTFLEAEGAYTGKSKKLIYAIVSSSEIPKVKEICFKYDPKAFMTINDISEVKGRGFKPKDY